MSLGIGRVFYEDTGNIGKGYRRHDEVGTPLCVTVDFQTIEESQSGYREDGEPFQRMLEEGVILPFRVQGPCSTLILPC